jgi:hypothetical protein
MRNILCLALLFSGCDGAYECSRFDEGIATHKFIGSGYSVRIPEEMSAEDASRVEDFELMEIGAGTTILSIYAGENPSFPESPGGENFSIRFKGHTAKVSEIDQHGEFSKDILLSLGDERFVHFFYSNLSAEEREIAEAVICSIEISDVDD